MSEKALILGAIGVLAETSDLQRRAFNTAFESDELIWHWDEDTYRTLLAVPGGRARLRHFADMQGADVDIEALYAVKVAAFESTLADGIPARPGIAEVIDEARRLGMKVGFATATNPRQVSAILNALSDQIDATAFDFIGDATCVAQGKPAPDIYELALAEMGVAPADAIAIEDTPESAEAALAAGIRTFAYPGFAARDRTFPASVRVIDAPEKAILNETRAAA